jgi:hypothetical protein
MIEVSFKQASTLCTVEDMPIEAVFTFAENDNWSRLPAGVDYGANRSCSYRLIAGEELTKKQAVFCYAEGFDVEGDFTQEGWGLITCYASFDMCDSFRVPETNNE